MNLYGILLLDVLAQGLHAQIPPDATVSPKRLQENCDQLIEVKILGGMM